MLHTKFLENRPSGLRRTDGRTPARWVYYKLTGSGELITLTKCQCDDVMTSYHLKRVQILPGGKSRKRSDVRARVNRSDFSLR